MKPIRFAKLRWSLNADLKSVHVKCQTLECLATIKPQDHEDEIQRGGSYRLQEPYCPDYIGFLFLRKIDGLVYHGYAWHLKEKVAHVVNIMCTGQPGL